MKGLVLKDLLSARTALPTLVVLLLLPISMMAVLGADGSMVILGIFVGILCTMNMVVALSFGSYDEQCGWDSFGGALPFSRKQIVLARYGADLILLLVSLLVVLVTQLVCLLIAGQPFIWYYPAVLVMFCLLTEALMNPVIYKFGAQKAGYIIAGISMAIGLGGSALGHWAGEQIAHSDEAVDAVLDNILESGILSVTMLLGVVGCVILFGLSILLSIAIYQKKEF